MTNQITIRPPERLRGGVVLPASKSISNRALVLSVLAERMAGRTTDGWPLLRNVSDCDDTRVMVQWLRGDDRRVDVGAAGTAMRFSTALLAVTPGEHVITGSERMCHRPIGVLVEALRQLGADVRYEGEEGFPPLRIVGRTDLEGGEVELPGNVSSQYISALLMIGPMLRRGLIIRLTDKVVSRPYINMTVKMMRSFGAHVNWRNANRELHVEPGGYVPTPYMVESDWSAASYWYEMVALSADDDACVVLPGLMRVSNQGDSRIATLFELLGVRTEYVRKKDTIPLVRLTKNGTAPRGLFTDLVRQPDLAQTLVATCCLLGVGFDFKGLESLRIKETDRILALRTELRKLGFEVGERDGRELFWKAVPRKENDMSLVSIDTYEDHRMAMALAPAALRLGELRMNDPQVVSKSYPKFWDDLRRLGFELESCPK